MRGDMRRLIAEIPGDSSMVCGKLLRILSQQPHLKTISAFAALPGEVDLSELIRMSPERCWVFPRVCGEDLIFHVVGNPGSDLVKGNMGIAEPKESLESVSITEIDAFLCPGLAFDRSGGRLGRGRGFYDRVLSRSRKDALKIGVCFPHQMVLDALMEPHDVRMDIVTA